MNNWTKALNGGALTTLAAVAPWLALTILIIATAIPVAAHHAIAAKFDPSKPVTLTGTVVQIDWANPHAHLFVNVNDTRGITNWAIELESPKAFPVTKFRST